MTITSHQCKDKYQDKCRDLTPFTIESMFKFVPRERLEEYQRVIADMLARDAQEKFLPPMDKPPYAQIRKAANCDW